MDPKAIKEIDDALKKTAAIRESSYDRATYSYKMTYHTAAEQAKVPENIKALVICILVAGFSDSYDWQQTQGKIAESQLAKERMMRQSKPKSRGGR